METDIAILLLAAGAAAWLGLKMKLPARTPTTRRTVKDSVPHEVDSPTLQERRDRAASRERVEEVAEEERRSGEEVDLSGTEFDWRVGGDVSFTDVGGRDELLRELEEDVILPFWAGERADELGISASSVVLEGPPGTGKTFVARALATEIGLPFVSLSGSSLQSKWINESADRVSTLFEEAEQVSEETGGAVVFVDELDTVLGDRGGRNSHEEDAKVVNELLHWLQRDNDVVFVGATNRADVLDDAGIRSGRVDKVIRVGMPDEEARRGILWAQLEQRPHSVSSDVVCEVASVCDGSSAADLSALVEEAAKNALLAGRREIVDADLYAAVRD